MNNYCNNCGKSGHSFHQCKIPITSIGIIAFRVVSYNDECSLNENKISNIEYLIIRRKETLGYIDFMRGKYLLQSQDYLINMFKQMTMHEKTKLKTETFEILWKDIWGEEICNNNQYKSEKIISKEKYNSLVDGVFLNNVKYTLNDLIEISNDLETWTEPEWGFPKGRRENEEKDYDCAVREFCEETGYSRKLLHNIQNIVPFEEIFTGSNYKSYKHKYYLMFMNYIDTLNTENFQKSEVSKMEWKTCKDCISYFRPYNLEKKRIINNVENALNNLILFQL
jgi:hypothetical protein